MVTALAFDAAWGGLGWAVCGPKGPLGPLGDCVGWAHFPRDLRDRYGRLVAELDLAFRAAEARRAISGGELIVCVEEPPQQHGGPNQASTSGGLGKCVGAVQLYARVRLPTVRPAVTRLWADELAIPEWRADYRPMVHGPTTAQWKATAVAAVAAMWPGIVPKAARLKLREDCSEAVLQGVHFARRFERENR